MEKVKKRYRPSVLSKNPYKRRSESEMIEIITEIHSGRIAKRAACVKYGLNRNTLALFIKKFAVRTLGEDLSVQILSDMTEGKKVELLEKKIKVLTKQLDHARLKNISLETLIRVIEEELKFPVKKKRGTKQSKE
jgi:hypothetical protein